MNMMAKHCNTSQEKSYKKEKRREDKEKEKRRQEKRKRREEKREEKEKRREIILIQIIQIIPLKVNVYEIWN